MSEKPRILRIVKDIKTFWPCYWVQSAREDGRWWPEARTLTLWGAQRDRLIGMPSSLRAFGIPATFFGRKASQKESDNNARTIREVHA
jgi:hypothetical protein